MTVIASAALLIAAWSPIAAPSATCLRPPVDAPIVDAFRPPSCPWCPGNRGVTYSVPAGTAVRAAASGIVTFQGSVAGIGYVVIGHADGHRATYGGLGQATVTAGSPVAAGAIVGRAQGAELHFGLRLGDVYVDPEPFIGRLVDRPRLVPTDGTAPRPAPPPTLRCGGPPPMTERGEWAGRAAAIMMLLRRSPARSAAVRELGGPAEPDHSVGRR